MNCPKCHQPLDGDEEYICCADATISWRCDACAKVSEGFAFPYGRCPHCGGTLTALEGRRIDDSAAQDAVRMAFEIELGGQAFYTRAAGEARDPALAELFGRFAEMESEHMATLSRRYHARVPAPNPEFAVERAAIYAGIDSRPGDPDSLFRIAIACEERAVAFFSERGAAAPEGSPARQLFRELAAEEGEHVAVLTTEYHRWRDDKPGLL